MNGWNPKQLRDSHNRVIRAIKNFKGEVIFSYCDDFLNLDGLDLSDAQMEGVIAEGLICVGAQFIRANPRNADLYMTFALDADFSYANLEQSDLRGANLTGAKCCNANLAFANLASDNVGGSTRLQDSDLSGAVLRGTNLQGAEYSLSTRFPKGFEPEENGMVLDFN